MDIGWATAQIIGGLVILILGGEILVRGASGVATLARISPLIIGLTVVSFGTSAPELAVSVQASYLGSGDIALGNVLGSNIFNLLVVLGVAAMVTPLLVSDDLFRRDLWWMLGATLALFPIGWDGEVSRLEAGFLFVTLVGYLVWLIRSSRRMSAKVQEDLSDDAPTIKSNLLNVLMFLGFVVVGLALLVLGSNWLTDGAVAIAQSFGVSELVIGLTIVATGTSLPEVITSVMAGIKGERDIAVGNVVGSNIFNVLCVLGGAGIVAKTPLPFPAEAFRFDLPIVVLISAVCLPVFSIGRTVTRMDGVLFVLGYVVYTSYLIFNASHSNWVSVVTNLCWFGLAPAAVVVLVAEYMIFTNRAVRESAAEESSESSD